MTANLLIFVALAIWTWSMRRFKHDVVVLGVACVLMTIMGSGFGLAGIAINLVEMVFLFFLAAHVEQVQLAVSRDTEDSASVQR